MAQEPLWLSDRAQGNVQFELMDLGARAVKASGVMDPPLRGSLVSAGPASPRIQPTRFVTDGTRKGRGHRACPSQGRSEAEAHLGPCFSAVPPPSTFPVRVMGV